MLDEIYKGKDRAEEDD
jgi:hypothetical protein